MSGLGSVSAILLSGLILYVGNGLQGMLLPIRGQYEAFPTVILGLMGSAYAFGFVGGCLAAPLVIRRVGHIRSFAVMAAVASSAVIAHALIVDPAVWLGLRVLSGMALAGLFMVVESWLNSQSDNRSRGRILSIYLVVNSGGIMLGQMGVALADPAGFTLFGLAAIAMTLALIPVGLTTSVGPAPVGQVRLRLLRLYRLSPVGMVGAFMVGAANGTFLTLGAVFIIGLGFDPVIAAAFVSASMLGGALAQIPAGAVSDRIDRRFVIVGFALAATAIALAMWLSEGAGPVSRLMELLGFGPQAIWILLSFLLGATAFPLYGVSAAHMNDFVDQDGFVEASGGLLLVWGIGATAGPFIASLMMTGGAPNTLFLFLACVYAGLAAFAGFRITRRTAPPVAAKDSYQAQGIVRTTPAAVSLDPRAPEEAAEEEKAA